MRVTLSLLGTLAFVGLAADANATYHTYAGEECTAWEGGPCATSYGACENRNVSPMRVDCPAHKTGTFSSAAIAVKDQSGTANVRCQLCYRYPVSGAYGLSGGCGPWIATSNNDGYFRWLYTYSSDISVSYTYSFYYYSCEIPGAVSNLFFSEIQSYYVIEN